MSVKRDKMEYWEIPTVEEKAEQISQRRLRDGNHGGAITEIKELKFQIKGRNEAKCCGKFR